MTSLNNQPNTNISILSNFRRFFLTGLLVTAPIIITIYVTWLVITFIDVKVANTMRDIDKQSEQIKKLWEEQDDRTEPTIVETGVFGDEGWSIEISNPIVGGGPTSIGTSMVPPSDAQ